MHLFLLCPSSLTKIMFRQKPTEKENNEENKTQRAKRTEEMSRKTEEKWLQNFGSWKRDWITFSKPNK